MNWPKENPWIKYVETNPKKSFMLPVEYKKIIEEYIAAYNEMNIPEMVRNFDQTIEFENQIDGRITLKLTGYNEFIEHAEKAKSYFSSRKQTLSNWNFEGNIVKVDVAFEGILAIELMDDKMPGDELQIKGTSEYVFFGNKIIQIIDRS